VIALASEAVAIAALTAFLARSLNRRTAASL
jgi:hypothetical protein